MRIAADLRYATRQFLKHPPMAQLPPTTVTTVDPIQALRDEIAS